MVHKNIPEKNLKNNDEEKSYNISFKKKRTQHLFIPLMMKMLSQDREPLLMKSVMIYQMLI